jgi:hypothetical protein
MTEAISGKGARAMSKKRNKAGKAQAGRGETGGAGFRPADLAEDEAQVTAPEGGAVPLGLPISDEEYEKLQKQSRHVVLPPTDSAQADPSE